MTASCKFNADDIDPKSEPDIALYSKSIKHDGLDRSYLLYLPENFANHETIPMILVLHGGGGSAQSSFDFNKWKESADKNTYAVVLADGTRNNMSEESDFRENPQSWNDGSQRQNIGAVVRNVDDVGFLEALLLHLQDSLSIIDNKRIYATGFSNGASMTFRLAREKGHLLKAIAPIAGTDWLNTQSIDNELPSLFYITGTDDPLNPFDGGDIYLGDLYLGNKPPVEEMIFNWIELLTCDEQIIKIMENNTIEYQFSCFQTSKRLSMLALMGHGHHWPGGNISLPPAIAGPYQTQENANQLIWDFFRSLDE